MISACAACLARGIFDSDAYFREVIEKLENASLTFFKIYCSSATFAHGWKRECTDSVLKSQTLRFLSISTCLMMNEIA